VIDRQNPVIRLRIAHGIEAEANEVEIETATTTRGPEVEGELVQDHHHQDKATASGIHLTEVLTGGGNYRGRHLPVPDHPGGNQADLHVTATDTYLLLEMIVITVTVTVIAIQTEAAKTKVEAMGLVAIRRQILYSPKC